MDDLYDNLDNFNEENTIAELQTENKDLKSKLEEYASALDKLQNDFDRLTSEYKKLELNYSSLLKTAKAEIERKTQIITNLNLEKDKMVLKSFQNKSVAPFSRSKAYDKSTLAQNCKEDKGIKSKGDSKVKENECSRSSLYVATTERKEEEYLTLKDTTASPQTDIRCKLLNMVNSDVKENDSIHNIQHENDVFNSRAVIKNRRKSMPAVSLEIDKSSAGDNDLASAGSSKELSRENTDKGHTDRNFSDRQSSRISETSSFEDRNSGYHEPNAYKSRYYSDKINRYRTRDKSSHRHKKSLDRYHRRSKDYHDNSYHRSEYDRHRAKGRVLESPPKDKYNWSASREKHRNNYEKSNPHNHEKLPYENIERYTKKHKIQHAYNESDSKRMKIEPHLKKNVTDLKLQEQREFLEKKYSIEPIDIQFSSCKSPDLIHPDVSTHQIREIKLTATTKLDDPRITNEKYVFKKNNGKVALCTVEGRNVDIVPINKITWGIKHVSMPEALVRRPSPEVEHTETENPVANILMESVEICDLEGLRSQNVPKKIGNNSKLLKSNDTGIQKIKFDETKNIENSVQKINSYKIPKFKKAVDDKQNSEKAEEITSLETMEHKNTPNYKKNTSHSAIRDTDVCKPLLRPAKEKELPAENKQVSSFIQSNNELPNLSSELYNEQKYLTAKEVVEGDLELSDDNFENNEQPINVAHENVCKIDIVKHSSDALERVIEEPRKIKTAEDAKKTKNKKKPRHKESKEEYKMKDPPQVSEKAAKKKDKEIETRKTEQIKTKFSELFDDSSSLISPEDLGLATVTAPTTLLPCKSVPFFEDALDAADLNAIKLIKDSNPSEESHNEENIQSSDITNKTKIEIIRTDSQESMDKNKVSKEVIKSIYKNLEPSVPETEEAVKTVIISTGVQPQIVVECERQGLDSDPEPQKRTANQGVALKALATSTPHKMWHLDVVKAEVGAKSPDTSSNSNNSRIASIENTVALDSSESNTLVSQTNAADVPDVRIFVRRRRKVIKK